MRTYTQCLVDGRVGQPHQAVVMLYILTDGPELTAKEISKLSRLDIQTIYSSAAVLVSKGWLCRPHRGTYSLTRSGRTTWTKIFDKELL